MQIRSDKYNLSKSSFIEVKEKNLDLKVDITLEADSTNELLGTLVVGSVVDSNNNPIKGAIVKLLGKDLQQLYRVTTDDQGKYIISHVLYSDIYTVSAIANGKLLSTSQPFTLTNASRKMIDFTLYDSPNVNLGVINGTLLDSNFIEVFGAVIFLYSVVGNNNILKSLTFTDLNGNFIFSQLDEGKYFITISKLGYVSTQIETIVTKNNISSLNLNLNNDPNASKGVISGIITNDSNKIIPNADVVLYEIDENNKLIPLAYTKTNPSGFYTFINVKKGHYIIKSNQSEEVDINNNEPEVPTNPVTIPNPSPNPVTIPPPPNPIEPDFSLDSINFLPLGTYEAVNGTLENGAKINKKLRFVEDLGGENDASVTLEINLDSSGLYNLVIEYLSADINRILAIDINEKNKEIYDGIAITPGWDINDSKTLVIQENLNNGKNIIKFHGDGETLAPNLGRIVVKKASKIIEHPLEDLEEILSYNLNSANISSGAKINPNNKFVTSLGGINDEFVTINISVKNSGIYNLVLQYLSATNNKYLKIDINGVDSKIIYTLPPTKSENVYDALTFTVPINLNGGINTIKFHGNGTDATPDLGELAIDIPPLTSNLSEGILLNGANVNSKTEFVENLGGRNNGAVTISINTSEYGIYILHVKYLGIKDNQALSVDLNGFNVGNFYNIPKTTGMELENVAVFDIFLNLRNGRNIITFHGDGVSPAPSLGSFTLEIKTDLHLDLINGVYNVGLGELNDGAILNIDYNIAEQLGGPIDGSSIVEVNVEQGGLYILTVDYKNSTGPLRVEVNGIDSGTVYNILEPETGKFSTDLKLEEGKNLIKFHGNGIDYAPNLGDFILTLKIPDPTTLPEGTYDLTLGLLENGAKIDEDNNIVDYLGGPEDGSVTIKVNVEEESLYDIDVEYEANDTNRSMMVDVNGINDNIDYILPMTSSWVSAPDKNFIFQIILNRGENTLKFHGNGFDYGPKLRLLKISKKSLPSTILPEGTYNAKDGLLENGAKLQLATGFVENIGGSLDGSITIYPRVNNSTIYNLAIEYISPNENKTIKIEVNGFDSKEGYTLPRTFGRTLSFAKIFNITIPLNMNVNKIKIHGDGINMAPIIGRLIISDSNNINILNYDASKGVLENGATINEETNFVRLLGGLEDGSVSVPVNVIGAGLYILSFKYIAPDTERPLNIDINNIHIEEIYFPSRTPGKDIEDALTFNVLINLKSGENTIKFNGDGVNYAPNIGTFTISPSVEIPLTEYNIANGILENGAIKDSSTEFLTNVGGLKDGSSTVIVNAINSGRHSLEISYICKNDDKSLKIDVNGINIGVYTLPMTVNYTVEDAEVFNIKVNLNEGDNIIKFHGNGIDNAPDLGEFTITPISESIINSVTPYFSNNEYAIGSYPLSKGYFLGGATVDYSTGLVKNIGGPYEGSCTINVYVNSAGNYLLRTQYSSLYKESYILYEVNGRPTGLLYLVQKTDFNQLALTSTKVYLNVGYNTIKFYSTTNSYGPMLGLATLG
ncbi:carboxypeptidase regulatory-like domain-containing protein, partial [Clostridium tarantellae]